MRHDKDRGDVFGDDDNANVDDNPPGIGVPVDVDE